ncbi:hypothetical protein K2173_003521 [Erythroxylum novogranatense]|uniref:Uncharacterized protein n=1 Tax=Erythroxylum novogranatense TaxID=1862640 RepID=A0AAV8TCL1_9ROSI|nr:hypothetical protein K2173_003521 [Erythroxylum novogranatense]
MDSQVAAQIVANEWLKSIIIDLKDLPPLSSNWSICKVPAKLRTKNKDAKSEVQADAYSPQIVSIGPLHHGSKNLASMENFKTQYMSSLLYRTQNPAEVLEVFGRDFLDFDKNVRACYAESIGYSKEDLAKILLRDGCFIIELFHRFCTPDPRKQNDPIFTTSWMLSTIQRDLALLENQVPFFVLEWLFNLTMRQKAISPSLVPLPVLALRFFKSNLNISEDTLNTTGAHFCHHLLDLIHKCYLPSSSKVEPKIKGESLELIHCATALNKAGIKFRKDLSKNLLDLKFEDGVFKIPPLCVHDTTDSLFRNLIAFEQCYQCSAQYITSYFLLMDRLIDTASDVELLVHKRIIENDLGGSDDVSDLFNNICKQVSLRDFHFAGLCEEVNAYYNKPWHKYKADLRSNYCRNPWTIISIIAGFWLLSLTTLQTVYTAIGYYPHKS